MTALPENDPLRTAAKGGSIVFSGNVAQCVLRAVLAVVLARLLGTEEFGLYNLALAVFFLSVDVSILGLPFALVKFVPENIRRGAREVLGVLLLGMGIPFLVGLSLGLCLLFAAPFIAQSIFGEPRLTPLLRLVAVILPFAALVRTSAAAAYGFKRMELKAISDDVVRNVLKLTLVILVGLFGLDALGALSIELVTQVTACGLLIYLLNRVFSLHRSWRGAHLPWKEMLPFSLPLYFHRFATNLLHQLPLVLLGILGTVVSAGIFSAVTRLVSVGMLFHLSMTVSSMPLISGLQTSNDTQGLLRLYRAQTRWSLLFYWPILIALLLFPGEILSVFGPSFVIGETSLVILSLATLVRISAGIAPTILAMTGHVWATLLNSLSSLAITAILCVFLIPGWGLVGAAGAYGFSLSLASLITLIQVFFYLRIHPFTCSLLKPAAAAFLSLGVAWGLARSLNETEVILSMIISLGVGYSLYLCCLLLFGFLPEEKTMMKKLVSRVIRWALGKREGQ